MSKTYIVIALVLLGLAGGLLLLPNSERNSDVDPITLFKEINDPARYVSVDLIAERLINEDPSIMLVDVRSADQFEAYSLRGALNIPLHEIALADWQMYLDQDDMDVVLYSNGDVFSDQAWIICSRLGYKNLYVMTGGLNKWFEDIMQPIPPSETAPSEDFDLYAFRQAASFYFGGKTLEMGSDNPDAESVKLIKRIKKTTAAGGC